MTLRKRMALIFMTLSVFIIMATAAVLYWNATELIRKGIQRTMDIQLERAAENISLLVELNRAETEVLAKDSRVLDFYRGNGTKEEMDATLSEMMRVKNAARDVYKDLFITDPSGRILATTMEEAQNLELSGRDYFETSRRTGRTVTSDILVARSDGENIIITMTPIRAGGQEPAGYAGIALKAGFFTEFMKGFVDDPNGYYVILDSKNLALSHPDMAWAAKPFPLAEPVAPSESGWSLNADGHLQKQRLLPLTRWKLVAFMDSRVVERQAGELLFRTYLTGFLLVLAAGAAIYYLSGRISRPIEGIITALNEAAENQMRLRNRLTEAVREDEPRPGDELQRLQNASNRIWRLSADPEASKTEERKLKETVDALNRTMEDVHRRTYDFLAQLSHDIRTPLTLIRGYSKGIGQYGAEAGIRTRYTLGIEESAKDIEKLIFDVVDSAYEVRDMSVLETEWIQAGTLARQVGEEAKLCFPQGEARLEIAVDDAADPIWVQTDVAMIRRVLFNLLGNAFKYAYDGSRIRFALERTAAGVSFSVINQGAGIAPEELPWVFDMFYRCRGALGKGYGMGLHIASRIVAAHGSTLRVYSVPGAETVFRFELSGEPAEPGETLTLSAEGP